MLLRIKKIKVYCGTMFLLTCLAVYPEGSDDENTNGKQEKKSDQKGKDSGKKKDKSRLPVPELQPAPHAPLFTPQAGSGASATIIQPTEPVTKPGLFSTFFNFFKNSKDDSEFLNSHVIEINSLQKLKMYMEFLKKKVKRKNNFSIRFTSGFEGNLSLSIRDILISLTQEELFKLDNIIVPPNLSRRELAQIDRLLPGDETYYDREKHRFVFLFKAAYENQREFVELHRDYMFISTQQELENFIYAVESQNFRYAEITRIYFGIFDLEPHLNALLAQVINNRLPRLQYVELFFPLLNEPRRLTNWNTRELLNYQLFEYQTHEPMSVERRICRIFIDRKNTKSKDKL